MLDIYGPVVRDSAASFEVEVPSVTAFGDRILETLRTFPWLVARNTTGTVGFAYASGHRRRQAYQWSVEVSVYVGAGHRRQGCATALYRKLVEVLRLQGFRNAYAGITLPNPPSVGVHESLGFQRVAVYRNVGYKLGAWHDVGWWVYALQPHDSCPDPPRPLPTLRDLPVWTELQR